MFKKTFYAFLVLGTMITIGSMVSGFISVTTATETTVKTEGVIETPLGITTTTGTWIGGVVNSDGAIKDAGTGGWTSSNDYQGGYTITIADGKKYKFGVVSPKYGTTIATLHRSTDGNVKVYTYYASSSDFYAGYSNTEFEFWIYVE